MFHEENARPHVSLTTRHEILKFAWNILPHPPNSLDLAPSDHQLLQKFHNFTLVEKLQLFGRDKTQLDFLFLPKSKAILEGRNFYIA